MIKVEKIKNGATSLEVHGSTHALAIELAIILSNFEKENPMVIKLAGIYKDELDEEKMESFNSQDELKKRAEKLKAEDTKNRLSLDDDNLRKALERLKEIFGGEEKNDERS